MSILDDMAEVRQAALARGAHLKGWEMNECAKRALEAVRAEHHNDSAVPFEQRLLFGLPVLGVIGEYDRPVWVLCEWARDW